MNQLPVSLSSQPVSPFNLFGPFSRPVTLARFGLIGLVTLGLVACGGGGSDGTNGTNGTNGLISLIETSVEPVGTNCQFGGTRIQSGIDNNDDSVLQTVEVTSTEFLCGLSLSAFDGLVYSADANVDGMRELFMTSKDSATVSKLIGPRSSSGDVEGFAVSPDKTRVAVWGDLETQGEEELFVISLVDGSAPVKVSGPLVAGGEVRSDFQWSPDSSRLAYRAIQDTDGVIELYSVLADGTGNAKVSGPLVAGGNVQSVFQWSPDSSRLAYQWSPDSSRLAYRADQDADGVFELYSSLAAGGDNVTVSGTLVAGGNVQSDFQWSPDSSRLAYRADQTTNKVDELYSSLADGAGKVKVSGPLVSANSDVVDFQWSPDSSRLAYRADQDTAGVRELYSVLPNASDNVAVSGPLVSANSDVVDFQWSPDSSRLAYRADQDTDGVNELYSSLAAGGDNVKVSGPLVTNGDVFDFSW